MGRPQCKPCLRTRLPGKARTAGQHLAWTVIWVDGSRPPSTWRTRAEAAHIATKARLRGEEVLVQEAQGVPVEVDDDDQP